MIKNPPTLSSPEGVLTPSREAILQAAERAACMGLAGVDVNGRQSYVSPAFCAMVGWSAEELLGLTAPFVYWPPEELPAIRDALARAVQSDAPPNGCELRLMRRSGERFFAQVVISPLTEAGAAAGWLTSVFELTERTQLEKERLFQEGVRESEQRFRTLVESTNNIVWQTDPSGLQAKPSPSWQLFTGQSEQVWTSGHGWDAVHAEDLPRLREAWSAAVTNRTAFNTEYRLRRADGVYVPMVVRAAPVCNADGSVREWIGTNVDISARLQLLESERAAYQEMRAARAESEAANRSKDLFLAMLGHELRNPLSPILTALELMRLRGGEDSFKERAIIERQVKHLVRLVDDLLDVSRITRGKIELTRESIEIVDVITRAIDIASPLLEQHSHYLSVLIPRKGLKVSGDSARLAQVFANLITNSAKYSAAGSQIVITGKREANQVVVAVKDSGQGIDAQLLPYVFDLFSQGERTIDRSQGGLGIGLTIVRSLVQLHGGQVTAASAGKGQGSEFQVRLPALEQAPLAGISPTSILPPAAPQRSLRVLVVDDNVDAAQLLYEALGMMGYKACVAHDGPSGLQAAIEFKPDAAFLDIGLPVMDGYELARRLHEWSSTVHLIAITGYGQDSDRKRSREAGFEQHLVKPLDLKRFRTILDELEKQKQK